MELTTIWTPFCCLARKLQERSKNLPVPSMIWLLCFSLLFCLPFFLISISAPWSIWNGALQMPCMYVCMYVRLQTCRVRFLVPRPHNNPIITPLSFALTRPGPENKIFYDHLPTQLYSAQTKPAQSNLSSMLTLRVRAIFHKTVRVCHVYCNYKFGFTCRITVIFGTLKDGSLLINTLTSNICFSCRNMFQNGVDALSKIVDAFLSKSSKFNLVRIIQ